MNKKITLTATIFVYGTLKKKHVNHNRYCRRNIGIEQATVCGKLYLLPPGYPALQVPIESVIDTGSHDAFYDAQIQYQENTDQDFEYEIYNGWNTVHGELITFPDPERDLPDIDKLEGTPFYYQRDLIPAKREDGSIVYAWVYTMSELPFGTRLLPDGVWPEKQIQTNK